MNSTLFLSRALCASALALLTFAGCQSARMPVPAVFESQAPLVAERGTTPGEPVLRLGAYQAHGFWRIEAGSPRASGSGDASDASAESQRYGFTLRLGDTDLWQANCSSKEPRQDAVRTDLVSCTLTAHGEASDEWTLVLYPMDDTRLAGMLRQDDAVYEVRGTDQAANALLSWKQTGYLMGQNGRLLAAVDLSDSGRVWMHTSTDVRETTLLTAASAALLLAEDIRAA